MVTGDTQEVRMAGQKVRVYCAGPLFNARERQEMEDLAKALREAGYDVFLPHQDGLELTRVVEVLLARGVPAQQASQLCAKAIFALDVYQVMVECDALVANLNGRVPDEGTVSEAAIAWCRGKAVVGYKSDSRSVFLGQDNPLVTGLFNFDVCETFEEILEALERELKKHQDDEGAGTTRAVEVAEYLRLGGQIWRAVRSGDKLANVTQVLLGQTEKGERRVERAVTKAV
jgi:nucleoside 2-deoxyribosyltransferase